MPSYFEYQITRPFTLRYFSPIIIVLGVLWIALITVINIATVGYESVTVESISFNSSTPLWYQRFFPEVSWIPKARNCTGSVIKANEGSIILPTQLIEDLWSQASVFNYNLLGFIDNRI